MKTVYITIFFLLLRSAVSMAQIYVDPATSAAVAAGAGMMNSQLDKTNGHLSLIEKAQLTVTGQLGIANTLQANIYRGLSEVSAVMRSLLSVRDVYEISQDIFSDARKAVMLAKDSPQLLLFAESGGSEFQTRATSLAAEVGSFVLKGGREGLMDSGERARLLNSIVLKMSILRGVTYGIYRSMYWAKQRGFLNSLNPYSGFVNIDKRIAGQIIANAKILKP
jgi:hypothetical protein